jgi:hypothetical protein
MEKRIKEAEAEIADFRESSEAAIDRLTSHVSDVRRRDAMTHCP